MFLSIHDGITYPVIVISFNTSLPISLFRIIHFRFFNSFLFQFQA